MKSNEYKSDICKLYENLAAMSETRKVSPEEARKEFIEDESSGSLITDTEKNILLERIAGQLGINDAGQLPYAAGLKEA